MTAILFDTNVLSELVRPKPDATVVAFVRGQFDPFISVVSLHELTYGADRAPPARQAKLTAWIAGIRAQFAGRIIPINEEIAVVSGRLRALAEAQGRPTEAIDALIAASAHSRGAAVATRNGSDFEPMGVTVIDPWKV